MKKHLLFLVSITISIATFGQTEFNDPREHKLRKESSATEKLRGFKHPRSEERLFSVPKFNKTQTATLKSSQEDKQALISEINKVRNIYNDQMDLSSKYEYTYAANGNNTSKIGYEIDNSNGQWVAYDKNEYVYDVNGNITIENIYNWDGNANLWVAYDKNEYTYDANGNVTLAIDYHWDYSLSQLAVYYKREYTYDVNGNNTLFIRFSWNSSTNLWIGDLKGEMSYDENGNNTLEYNYHWENSTSQWVIEWKGEYTYDEYGNNTLINEYDWDINTSQWIVEYFYQTVYTYDNENLEQILSYEWNISLGQWIGDVAETYTYNIDGNMTQMTYWEWDNDINEWIKGDAVIFGYNTLYSYNDLLLPNYLLENMDHEKFFQHMLIGYANLSWNADISEYVWEEETELNYSSQIISTTDNPIPNLDIEIYPNPATDYIVFNLQNTYSPAYIELIDMFGRTVLTQELSQNNTLSVGALKSGIYIYKLTQNEETLTGKVSIK